MGVAVGVDVGVGIAGVGEDTGVGVFAGDTISGVSVDTIYEFV